MSDRFRTLVEQAPCCILELDADGRFLSVNQAALAVMGLTAPDDALGAALTGCAIAAARPEIAAAVVGAQARGRAAVTFDLDEPEPRRRVEVTLQGVDGPGARRVVGFAREVTPERDLLALIEMSPLPTLVGRPQDGVVLLVNDAFVETSGFRREHILNRPGAAEQMWRDPAVRARVVDALARDGRIVGVEVTFVDARGEPHETLLSARATRVMGQDAVVFQTLDVTRAREVERRLAQLERLESLALLSGGIAHDFNNLLTAILGHLHVARDLAREPAMIRSLDRAAAAAERSAELTRQLLDYAGGGDPVAEPVALDEIADEVVDLLADTALRGVRVERVRGGGRVSASATQVRQVLLNLLTNASDAVSGRPAPAVWVRGASLALTGTEGWLPDLQPGNYGVIEVVDNGPGFSAEAALRAFEPFYTTRGTGRGLGLASVLGLVRRYGGGVRLTRSGKGACVQVALPTWEEPTPTGPAEPAKAATGRILVVDDEPVVCRAVAGMARAAGWTAREANGMSAAIARIAEALPDVILMDVRMPDVKGADGLRRIRAAAPDVPVVMMSGFADESVRAELRAVGIAGFLEKPFGPPALAAALSRAIQGS